MKIISTPPQRYRPRVDFEGEMQRSAGKVMSNEHTISISGTGVRHWRVDLTVEEFRELVAFGTRYLERHEP